MFSAFKETKTAITKFFNREKPISKEEKSQIERIEKQKYAIERLKELRNLFIYLFSRYPNRAMRKRAMKEFVSKEGFAENMIQNVINHYEGITPKKK